MPLLTVENLTIDFRSQRGSTRAVAGVSLTVERGEVVAIVGESGSGKSVTALALLGLLQKPAARIVSGTARFATENLGEVDLLQLSETELQRVRGNDISMIFQEPMTSLNPVLTCGYQVVEALRLHTTLSAEQAEARTIELFGEAQLPRPAQIFKSYPHEISGGQKQRVMIAMAMACRPALLIADEPTTALDVTVQARILQLIRDLRREHGTAVLFITHDLGVVAEIADRILVMYCGRVVEQGPVFDIFTRPQHPYTQGLLACRPRLSIGRTRLPVVADFMSTDAAGNLVARAVGGGGAMLVAGEIRTGRETAKGFPVEQGEPLSQALSAPLPANPIPLAPFPDGEGGTSPSSSARTDVGLELETRTSPPSPPGKGLGDGVFGEGAANSTQPLLQVENLLVYFPLRKSFFARTTDLVRAVDDVSFVIYPGETVGLVGESGCGKTTLGRALLRLTEPTAGRILFGGTDLARLPAGELRHRRRELQLVFQDPYAALNPMLTVGEAILEPLRVHGVGGSRAEQKARVRELLRTVGLSDDAEQRYPHEFSGGQRQRICIARALALRPKLIVCDESVSALDVSVQAQVLNLLNELKRELGITYLFITHDLSVARFMSDRLLVMSQGKIVEAGPAAELYLHPQHPYTQSLLAAIPSDDPARIAARVAAA